MREQQRGQLAGMALDAAAEQLRAGATVYGPPATAGWCRVRAEVIDTDDGPMPGVVQTNGGAGFKPVSYALAGVSMAEWEAI